MARHNAAMCRLFGFRSVFESRVHKGLVGAENAFGNQSVRHPDGWGVAYYIEGAPHILKSEQKAIEDKLFQQISGVVTSKTVLAHIRKATKGQISILNTHPFQFGKWSFAHNGNIRNFKEHRSKLKELILPRFQSFILGQTDSEVIFFIVLSEINKRYPLSETRICVKSLSAIIREAVHKIVDIIGPLCPDPSQGPEQNYLTFLLSNGPILIGHQGGQPLHSSTFKKRCEDREECDHFNLTCEQEIRSGKVNHLFLSSEPLSGENIWNQLSLGQVVGVDSGMEYFFA